MSDDLFPASTPKLAKRRKQLAPETHEAFQAFSRAVFADGALPAVTKQLIAVAVAHTTQCPYCIKGHTRAAAREGASREQIMEAIWVAAEMRAGGAYAHSVIALEELGDADDTGRRPVSAPQHSRTAAAPADREPPRPHRTASDELQRQVEDEKLDQALKATFPASDPFSFT